MARYSLSYASKTMTAVADTTNMTDNGYAAFLQGGGSTQQLKINEVSLQRHVANVGGALVEPKHRAAGS